MIKQQQQTPTELFRKDPISTSLAQSINLKYIQDISYSNYAQSLNQSLKLPQSTRSSNKNAHTFKQRINQLKAKVKPSMEAASSNQKVRYSENLQTYHYSKLDQYGQLQQEAGVDRVKLNFQIGSGQDLCVFKNEIQKQIDQRIIQSQKISRIHSQKKVIQMRVRYRRQGYLCRKSEDITQSKAQSCEPKITKQNLFNSLYRNLNLRGIKSPKIQDKKQDQKTEVGQIKSSLMNSLKFPKQKLKHKPKQQKKKQGKTDLNCYQIEDILIQNHKQTTATQLQTERQRSKQTVIKNLYTANSGQKQPYNKNPIFQDKQLGSEIQKCKSSEKNKYSNYKLTISGVQMLMPKLKLPFALTPKNMSNLTQPTTQRHGFKIKKQRIVKGVTKIDVRECSSRTSSNHGPGVYANGNHNNNQNNYNLLNRRTNQKGKKIVTEHSKTQSTLYKIK